MKISVHSLPSALLILALCGYPFLAGIGATFSFQTTYPSILMRSVVVLLSIILIYSKFKSHRAQSIRTLLLLMLIYWVFYIIRIIYSGLLDSSLLSKTLDYYLIWSFGACALPMFGLALSEFNSKASSTLFWQIYVISFFTGIFIIISGSTNVTNEYMDIVESGRLRLENLNPISSGHVGLTILILAIWGAGNSDGLNSAFQRIFFLFGAPIGFFILVASNSRGPVVAGFFCLIVALFYSRFIYKVIALSLLVLIPTVILPFSRYIGDIFGFSYYSRDIANSIDGGTTGNVRSELYANAIQGFFNSPIFGSYLEDPTHAIYPHNLILESFVSMGLAGGLIFLIVNFVVFVYAYRMHKSKVIQSWIPLVFIQYVVGAQFSGAIYSSTNYWILLGFMLSLANTHFKKSKI